MEILEKSRFVKTTDLVSIKDEKLDIVWFISIEREGGKFKKISENINPQYFQKQGRRYMQKVYDLAYNSIEDVEKKL